MNDIPWVELLDQPATAEVWRFGTKTTAQYGTLLEALYEYYDSLIHGGCSISNIIAADGNVYKKG